MRNSLKAGSRAASSPKPASTSRRLTDSGRHGRPSREPQGCPAPPPVLSLCGRIRVCSPLGPRHLACCWVRGRCSALAGCLSPGSGGGRRRGGRPRPRVPWRAGRSCLDCGPRRPDHRPSVSHGSSGLVPLPTDVPRAHASPCPCSCPAASMTLSSEGQSLGFLLWCDQ